MVSLQTINLLIATATNILALYLCVTTLYWSWSRAVFYSPRFRMLLLSIAIVKFGIWLWSLLIIGGIIFFDAFTTLGLVFDRAVIFLAVAFQATVLSSVKPTTLDGM